MSFHLSGEDIRVEDNHILVAQLRNEDGEMVDASIDLNDFVGNDNGTFHWDGEGFNDTAQDVHFAIEGDGEVPVLRGELQNLDGEWVAHDLNLAERIVNDNGQFAFH